METGIPEVTPQDADSATVNLQNVSSAPDKKKIPWWVWVIGIIVFIWIIGKSGGNGPNSTNSATVSSATNKVASVPVQPSIPWKNQGMYKVGKDIDSGEYFVQSDSSNSYFQVSKDSTGSITSIISNDLFTNSRYITVSDGTYIELKNCRMVSIDAAPIQTPIQGKYTEGMYKVGRDIGAGEHKVIPDGDMSYVEVSKDSKGVLNSILTNDGFSATKYVTIKEGQYIKLVGCYIQD